MRLALPGSWAVWAQRAGAALVVATILLAGGWVRWLGGLGLLAWAVGWTWQTSRR